MGKGSDSANSAEDAMGGALAIGIAGCVIGLLILKYLPPVALGAGLGLMLYYSRYGKTLYERIKTYLFSLAFLVFLDWVLIGLPTPHLKSDFFGILWWVPGFWDWCFSWARAWNENAPGLQLARGLRVKSLNLYDVENYVALSLISALAFSGIYAVLPLVRKKRSTARTEWGGELDRATRFAEARIPAALFEAILSIICLSWLRTGIRRSLKIHTGSDLVSVLLALLGFTGASFVIGHYLVPMVPFTNLLTPLYDLAYLPTLSLGVGFWAGSMLPGSVLLSLGFEAAEPEDGSAPSAARTTGKPGFLLGKTPSGQDFRLTERNLGYHVEMIAPSGAGKTNTLKNLIADRIARGHGVIFLDLKGEFDGVHWMYRAAKASGREDEMRLLSLTNRELSVPYNPIKYGSDYEIHSQLMNAMSWSEEYYRNISSTALMTLLRGLCEYRDRTGERFTLLHLYQLLEQPVLLRSLNERLSSLGVAATREIAVLAEKLDRPSEKDKLSGLIANLNLLIYSAAGPLLTQDALQGSFDFKEAIDEGRLSYFLMNSLKLKESASVLGKMILQDLMGFIGERYARLDASKPHRPITLIIDEFASFAVPEFIEFMDRARGAGIGIVIAHQSRADLRAISTEFQERIETNSNTAIVSGLKSSQDAEHYAGMLGTRTTEKETRQVEEGLLFEKKTGMKSLREVEEYILHPNKLKQLEQGHVFAIARTVDPRWALVKVPQAKEFSEQSSSAAELTEHLTRIRGQYLERGTEKYLDLENLAGLGSGLKRELATAAVTEKESDWS